MAAAAREDKQKQAYEGLGAGGKFRKTPFRRTTQATPYDRPPTSLRNPTVANDGWLSKLVDPAQRLIFSSAHRLFSSVFRKRLPPPPPPPQSPLTGVNHEARIKGKEEVSLEPSGVQKGRIDQSAGPSTTAGGGDFTELEQILEHKTFTRSEIDRLTALLHSRTVDIPIENQEKRSEVRPSKPVVSHNRNEEFSNTPVQGKNGIESRLASNPVVSTSVLDEDVASPAELAKAYMGSRPSKVSPSMLGLRGQAHHEDSPILTSLPFSSKTPIMSLVPWTSGNGGAPENGFMTPRSRGRSAIYSMARTPYSRVRTASTFKGAVSTIDSYGGGSSSSQSVWEQSQHSGSKGASKRRFSVLDNDIGSSGPIRRIRQKPNLLSTRGLSSPISTSTSINGTRISSEASQHPSSSMWKPLSLGEPKHKALSENADNAVPSPSIFPVSSQHNKMAIKILEQLDKLDPPKKKSSELHLRTARDKSPTKLSPSMLHGQALKSLEDADSTKCLDNISKNSSKLDASSDQLTPDARGFTSQKQDKVIENGPLRIGALSGSSAILMNGEDSTIERKDIASNVKTAVSAALNSVVHSPQKKQGFKMSAHEDLELDDEDNFKVETFSTEKSKVSTTTVTLEESPAFSNGPVRADNGSNFISSSVSSSSMTVLPTVVSPQASYDKVAPSETHTGPSGLKFGVTSMKDSDAASPVLNFNSKSVDKVAWPESTFSSPTKPESSNSVFAVGAGASNYFFKPQESDKADFKNNSDTGVPFGIPETDLSSTVPSAPSSTVSFGALYNNSNPNNESRPVPSFSASSVFSLTSPNSSGNILTTYTSSDITTTTAVTANSNNVSGAAPAPSFPAASIFKFEPSTVSTVVTTAPVKFSSESLEGKSKEDKGFGNLSSSFSGASDSLATTGIGFFGLSSSGGATTSTANQSQGSLFGVGNGAVPISSQASTTGTGIASFAQSAPAQFGSSASSVSFQLDNSASKLFSSGASAALGSSTSSLEANSISSSTAPSSWPAKSSVFAPTSNPSSSSTGFPFGLSSAAPTTTTSSAQFVFGGSSTAAPATNTTNSVPNTTFIFGGPSTAAATTSSAPAAFGGSTVASAITNSGSMFGSSNSASSTTMFSFTQSANTSAPSQPAFGTLSPAFPMGLAGNNDQMNMDSMAEDTNQAATPALPVFGQQPVFSQQPAFGQQPGFGQQPVSTPQAAFGFQSAPTGSMANPFQFPSQQNLGNQQNPSLFQSSGSLGASQGGGSFSLGAGGDKANRRMVKVKHNRPRKK